MVVIICEYRNVKLTNLWEIFLIGLNFPAKTKKIVDIVNDIITDNIKKLFFLIKLVIFI